jgi:hypothetical protein
MSSNDNVMDFQDMAYQRLLEEMNEKDDLTLRLGDTLDIKASILLAAITLLATQTAYFLDKRQTGVANYLLIGSVILLCCGTIAAFWELWPRTYLLPVPEKSGIDRAAELRGFYSQHEGVEAGTMFAEFTKDEIGWAQFRISTNQNINKFKSKCLEWSFYLTGAAMVLNIATLLMRLF